MRRGCSRQKWGSAGDVLHRGPEENVEKKDLCLERNIMSIFLPNKIKEVVRIFYEILRNKTQVLDGCIECVLRIRGRQGRPDGQGGMPKFENALDALLWHAEKCSVVSCPLGDLNVERLKASGMFGGPQIRTMTFMNSRGDAV